MDIETKKMDTRPNIQIDEEVREMTEEEFAEYETLSAHSVSLADAD
jgi:hypothetical protein